MSGLPRGWVEVALGEICLPVEKRDPRNEPHSSFRYVDIGGIEQARIVKTKSFLGKDAPSRARQVVRAGDTVLSTVRTYLKKTALIPPQLDGAIASTGFCVLRPAPGIEPSFLFHRVVEHDFVARLSALQTGSSYPAVRDRDVLAQPIAVPPLEEQRRIVAAIEEQFSRIESAERSLSRATRLIESLTRSVLLTSFPPTSPGRKIPVHGLLTTNIGGVWGSSPGASEVDVAVFRITEFRDGGVLDPSTAAKRSVTRAQLRSRQLKPGDLLLEKSGGGPERPVGRVALVSDYEGQAVCSNFLQLLRPDAHRILPEYLFRWLQRRYVEGSAARFQTASTNIRNLKTREYLALSVPVPSLAQQREIVARIEQGFGIVEVMLRAVDAARGRAAALRRSIQARAFNGELVPQDSRDEPATVLLERIRQMRPEPVVRARRRPTRKRHAGQETLA